MRYSPLRRAVLLALSKQPIGSVSEFAKTIGCHRSAVSRCLTHLQKLGFVQCEQHTWALTEQGKQIIAEEQRYPYERMERLTAQLAEIAMQHNIPLVAAYEQGGFLRIIRHNIHGCSEIACAYGELTGWANDD